MVDPAEQECRGGGSSSRALRCLGGLKDNGATIPRVATSKEIKREVGADDSKAAMIEMGESSGRFIRWQNDKAEQQDSANLIGQSQRLARGNLG